MRPLLPFILFLAWAGCSSTSVPVPDVPEDGLLSGDSNSLDVVSSIDLETHEPDVPDTGEQMGGETCNSECSTEGTCSDLYRLPPNGSCKWYLAGCLEECKAAPGCKDEDCWTVCREGLSPESVFQVDLLTSCLEKNGCFDAAGEPDTDCVEEHCLDEYFFCFGGPSIWGCDGLVGCLSTCPGYDWTVPSFGFDDCADTCWTLSDESARSRLVAVIECRIEYCPVCVGNPDSPACNPCFQEVSLPGGACFEPVNSCLKIGNAPCWQTLNCVKYCTGSACVQDCLMNLCGSSKPVWDTMVSCILDACPICDTGTDQECEDCTNAALADPGLCLDEHQACLDDGCT